MNPTSPRRIGLPFLPNFTFISHRHFAPDRPKPVFFSSVYNLLNLPHPQPIGANRRTSNYVIDKAAILHNFDGSIFTDDSLDKYQFHALKIMQGCKRQPSTPACTSPAKAIPSACRQTTSRDQLLLAGRDCVLSAVICPRKQGSSNPRPNNPIL